LFEEEKMSKDNTLRGKVFYYKGNLQQGLSVYFTEKDNSTRTENKVKISKEVIDYIKKEIQKCGDIAMGACRDKPPPNSLGAKLKKMGISPQVLSYVIPLLKKVGFCSTYKVRNAYIVKK
jgi:hypothetical protein